MSGSTTTPPLGGGLLASLHLTGLWATFGLAVRQNVRARRIFLLVLLFCVPIAVTLVARWFNPDFDRERTEIEFALVFYMIPHALMPLAALLLASAMIQDEVEDQTLTYLLIRPLPRWGIYMAKAKAAALVAAGLTAAFTLATFAAVWLGGPDADLGETFTRAFKTIAILALAVAAYVGLFGLVSMLTKRTLVFGVTYIVIFEGIFANIDFLIRKLTVMWYVRVLAERWIGMDRPEWGIELDTAPAAWECVAILLGIGVIGSILGALTFHNRELRVKTPEGN